MIDRLFASALAFCVLAAGTVAIATAWFESPPAQQAAAQQTMPVVHLQKVEVVGKRVERPTTLATREATEPAARQTQ